MTSTPTATANTVHTNQAKQTNQASDVHKNKPTSSYHYLSPDIRRYKIVIGGAPGTTHGFQCIGLEHNRADAINKINRMLKLSSGYKRNNPHSKTTNAQSEILCDQD